MPLRDMDREQMWMLPPTLDELLPLDHPARFVAEFVDALGRDGWSELGVEIGGDPLGAPAYHPRALLSVWLYGFMTGVRSCRKLEAACRDQISYLWLTGWQHPDHNTLWRFYKGHRQAMRKLFERTVRTAVTMKLVDLAVQAVDGTKVVANASLNRSYDAEGLRGLLDRVERAIEDLEAQNEAGEDTAAADLPEELADKKVLREKVKQAMLQPPTPRLPILQHHPQAQGRFKALGVSPRSPRALKVALRRFCQVRAARAPPGSDCLSYEHGCRVEGRGEASGRRGPQLAPNRGGHRAHPPPAASPAVYENAHPGAGSHV